MIMTFQQIKDMTVGAVQITQTEGAIQFYRYTQRQREVFASYNPQYGEFSESTCGIRMDFHTDAAALMVTVASAGKYEVMVDSLTICCETLNAGDVLYAPFEAGEKRVTFVLPSHKFGSIQAMELENATYARAHEFDKKLLFCGDSITQGWDCKKDTQSFAWLVSRYYNAESMILGVGGTGFYPDTIEDVGFKADAVVVALGTNDFAANISAKNFRANASAYFRKIAEIYAGKTLFCVTPIWRQNEKDVKAAGTLEDVRQLIAEEANKYGFHVVNGNGMVPHLEDYFADEVLHPNDLGFALYALNLIKEMNQHL